MTKIYFADRTKNFTRKIFKSLLDFAYLDEDERDRAIGCSWIETGRTIKFKVSKAQLQDLYGGLHSEKTFENEIRPAITSYLKVLGVIENMKTRKDLREFELHLWHETKEGNLERFDKEWENQSKVSTKIKSVSKRKQEINWRTACQNLLDRQKQQITSSPLHRKAKDLDSVHVPLGLMERKESERPKFDQTQEISPERGSEAYQQGYTETKRVEHDAFLAAINQRQPGEHMVILGEPGAGKTTLLMKVWEWLLEHEQPGEDIIVAWVPLAAVKNNELEEYLHKSWIKQFCKTGEIDRYWASFEELADAGRVWLLLDGADEMGGEALGKLEVTLREVWARSTRAIVTCRLNLWDASSHKLQTSANFQVYRTLDFKYVNPAGQDEVKAFIDNWFRSNQEPETGYKLRAALDEVGKERIKDLAQNPLRLALLCDVWDDEQKLPETQAGLYELFVDYVYDWKANEFPEAVKLRGELDRALGDLAKQGINKPSLRFRFTEAELRKWVPVVEHCQALMDLGWLNCVGEENKRPVFAFFHPTFQEYFAACSIDDWDYFLPRAHVDRPVPCLGDDKPTYRVFELEWRQSILLWFGRGNLENELKEKFLWKLTNFNEQGKKLYYYRAYCTAALCINEFRSSSQYRQITKQLVIWKFGYFNGPTKRHTDLHLIRDLAARSIGDERISALFYKQDIDTILLGIDIGYEKAIALKNESIALKNKNKAAEVIEFLRYSMGDSNYFRRVIVPLLREKVFSNRKVVFKLVQELSKNYLLFDHLSKVILESINTDKEVIKALFDLSSRADLNEQLLFELVLAIRETTFDSEKQIKDAINVLICIYQKSKLIDTNQFDLPNEIIRSVVKIADNKIFNGSNKIISLLIEILEIKTLDNGLFYRTISLLETIAVGNKNAITSIITFLQNPTFKENKHSFISALKIIGVNDKDAISMLKILLLANIDRELTCDILSILKVIAIENNDVIELLISIIRSKSYESLIPEIVEVLCVIGRKTEKVFIFLIELCRNKYSNPLHSRAILESLIEMIPENRGEIVISHEKILDLIVAMIPQWPQPRIEEMEILIDEMITENSKEGIALIGLIKSSSEKDYVLLESIFIKKISNISKESLISDFLILLKQRPGKDLFFYEALKKTVLGESIFLEDAFDSLSSNLLVRSCQVDILREIILRRNENKLTPAIMIYLSYSGSNELYWLMDLLTSLKDDSQIIYDKKIVEILLCLLFTVQEPDAYLFAGMLSTIAVNDKYTINTLLELLNTQSWHWINKNKDFLCRNITEILLSIITEKEVGNIWRLKEFIEYDGTFPNQFPDLYNNKAIMDISLAYSSLYGPSYDIVFHCAQILSFSDFYAVWNPPLIDCDICGYGKNLISSQYCDICGYEFDDNTTKDSLQKSHAMRKDVHAIACDDCGYENDFNISRYCEICGLELDTQ